MHSAFLLFCPHSSPNFPPLFPPAFPGTYQPQDHLQAISDKEFTRQELGLPAKGFVFVCFNRPHKIDPEVFALWMQILLKVPGSVLWLYESIQASPTKQALKQEAAEAGVEPERLIFANKVPKTLHLARLRAADLMLDTLHYNAHTTTSDALWAGVPVLTCPGKTFSSRVAASIVSAAGSQFANKLVADSPAQYVEMAVEFGLGGSLFFSLSFLTLLAFVACASSPNALCPLSFLPPATRAWFELIVQEARPLVLL